MTFPPAVGGAPRLELWPQPYAVVTLAEPPSWPSPGEGRPPVLVAAEAGQVTVVAPAAVLAAVGPAVRQREDGWRLLTLAGEYPPAATEVLAAFTRALAEARVPARVFSSCTTHHLLVPDRLLGRALAALAQVYLPA